MRYFSTRAAPTTTAARKAFAVLACTVAAACSYTAAHRVQPGEAADEVLRSAGRPTTETTLADGTKEWFYVHGPGGYTTTRVRFSPDGRVIDESQVLTEENFRRSLAPGRTTERDVLDSLGPPGAQTRHPNLDDVVWTYRWMNVQQPYLLDVHFRGSSGVVATYNLYPDTCRDLMMQQCR